MTSSSIPSYIRSKFDDTSSRLVHDTDSRRAPSDIRAKRAIGLKVKTCTSCLQALPLDRFYVRKSGRKAGQTMSGKCKQCYGARVKDFADANREAVRAANRVAGAKFRDANRDRERKRVLAHFYANRDAYRQVSQQWRLNNPDKHAAKEAKRRATNFRAVPVWADIAKIREIYAAAKIESQRTGVAMHVDHVVPLQSDIVCGLHCEANLEVKPATENLSKSNRWWPDMP